MRLTAALASISILAACAPRPGNIQPTFVPPETYENLTCDQISTERDRIRDKVNRLTDQQNQKATTDAVAVAQVISPAARVAYHHTCSLTASQSASRRRIGGNRRNSSQDTAPRRMTLRTPNGARNAAASAPATIATNVFTVMLGMDTSSVPARIAAVYGDQLHEGGEAERVWGSRWHTGKLYLKWFNEYKEKYVTMCPFK